MGLLIQIASYWNEFCLVGLGAYILTFILGLISGFSLFSDSIIGTIFSVILAPFTIISGLIGQFALEIGIVLLLLNIVFKIIN